MIRQYRFLLTAGFVFGFVAACDPGTEFVGGSGTGNNNAGGGPPSDGGAGNMGGMGSGAGNFGGSTFVTGGAGGQNEGGTIVNPCGTKCLEEELCDGLNKGVDDDCDFEVDEGCPCNGGQASSCFKGDKSFLTADYPECAAGTMSCTELGTWGPCNGGLHADNVDFCFNANADGCHAINAVPFATTDLTDGTGNFSAGADSFTFEVTCPAGVDPCPLPTGTDYTALQSGEYTVTYTKVDNGVESECSFALYVGAPGLRVELSWNFADGPFDLDLHMKQPGSTADWAISGDDADCGYGNCRASDFVGPFASGPEWFPVANMAPEPCNWYEHPDFNQNSCYFAPVDGGTWAGNSAGCHNPRLDLDNVSCNASVTDPSSSSFCAPENINIDYPPTDQWVRVGVYQFSHSAASETVFPNVKIFCDGALSADLGALGYDAPFDWTGAEAGNREYWLVADVLYINDPCSTVQCIVEPLYADPVAKTPLVVPVTLGNAPNGPPYPPLPQ